MPFLAHFGMGLITKYINPRINVWILLVAAMLLDILSIFLTSALWIAHGLSMALIWSFLAMGITALVTHIINQKNLTLKIPLTSTAITIGLLVFSHWILDFIGWPMTVAEPYGSVPTTGTPIFFNDTLNFGLGVYRTWVGALSMEIGILLIGLVLYIKSKRNQANKKKSERDIKPNEENN